MIERFRPGEPFGAMVRGKGLVIGPAEADRLNAIAEALDGLSRATGAGRVRRTPGGLHADAEVPETFHARLTSAVNPYTWVESRRTGDGTAWEDVPLGRNSTDDGTAREYNATDGLQDKVVLMQRWPGGEHRFVRTGIGAPDECVLRVCVECDGLGVEGASIEVQQDGVVQASCTTGVSGCCEIDLGDPPLPAGTWTAHASWGYESASYERSQTITSPCDEVTFLCDPIWVRVLGCELEPIEGATVTFYGPSDVVLGTETTDSNGETPEYDRLAVVKFRVAWPWGDSVTVDGGPFAAFVAQPFEVVYDPGLTDNGDGWVCCGCNEPAPRCDTVPLTDPAGNVVPLTYQATPWLPGHSFALVGCRTYTASRFFEQCHPLSGVADVPVVFAWPQCSDSLYVIWPAFPTADHPGTISYEFQRCVSEVVCDPDGGHVGGGFQPIPFVFGCGLDAVSTSFGVYPRNVGPPTSKPEPCSRPGGTWEWSTDLGPRTHPTINDNGFSHPLSYLAGWGDNPTFSIVQCAGEDEGGEGLMMAAVAPATGGTRSGPTFPEMRANAEACGHFVAYSPADRPGCGCRHRCTAGMSPQRDMVPPGDGVTARDCWACPLAPRHRSATLSRSTDRPSPGNSQSSP